MNLSCKVDILVLSSLRQFESLWDSLEKSESHSEARLCHIFQTSTLNIFLPISKLDRETSLKEISQNLFSVKNLHLKLGA